MSANYRGQYRVFVTNLGPGCRQRDVEHAFRDAGIRFASTWFPDSGRFLFVDFDRLDEAERAVREMAGKLLHGVRLQVEMGRETTGKPPPPPFRGDQAGDKVPRAAPDARFRLVVTGLGAGTSWQDLKDVMRGTGGTVTFTSVTNPACGGEGYAEFATEPELLAAIKQLDGTQLDGHRIEVRRDENVEVERGMGGGGGGRGRQPRGGEGRRRRSPSPPARHRRSRRSASPPPPRRASAAARSRTPPPRHRHPRDERSSRSPTTTSRHRRDRSPRRHR